MQAVKGILEELQGLKPAANRPSTVRFEGPDVNKWPRKNAVEKWQVIPGLLMNTGSLPRNTGIEAKPNSVDLNGLASFLEAAKVSLAGGDLKLYVELTGDENGVQGGCAATTEAGDASTGASTSTSGANKMQEW